MKWELLLVDDEQCLLETLADLLTEDDIVVTTAKNGEEGLALLKKKKFDVVVSDINLPVKSGPAMFSDSTSQGIFVPYIFFSATADQNLKQSLRAQGAIVVDKPHFEKLSAEVNSVLTKKEFLRPIGKAYSEAYFA